MKTFGKLAFGFSAVNAGQRNVSYEPELVAGANAGSFRITPPVSKALLWQHGDNIMFVTNADNIDAAIRDKAPEVVEFCTANGLDIDSMEAANTDDTTPTESVSESENLTTTSANIDNTTISNTTLSTETTVKTYATTTNTKSDSPKTGDNGITAAFLTGIAAIGTALIIRNKKTL